MGKRHADPDASRAPREEPEASTRMALRMLLLLSTLDSLLPLAQIHPFNQISLIRCFCALSTSHICQLSSLPPALSLTTTKAEMHFLRPGRNPVDRRWQPLLISKAVGTRSPCPSRRWLHPLSPPPPPPCISSALSHILDSLTFLLQKVYQPTRWLPGLFFHTLLGWWARTSLAHERLTTRVWFFLAASLLVGKV